MAAHVSTTSAFAGETLSTTRRDALTRAARLAAATAAAVLAPAGAALAMAPKATLAAPVGGVPLTGDAPLFALIEEYRAEVAGYRAMVTAAGKPLYKLMTAQLIPPLERLRCEIITHKPESVSGALAILGMLEEFHRDEADLYLRPDWGPRVADMPALNLRPILERLAGRATT